MKKLLFKSALAALVLAAPAAEAAKKKHKVTLNATVQAHAVTTAGGLIAGTLSDPVLGNGATVYHTSAAGGANGTTNENVTFQAWTNLGSVKGSGTLTVTAGPGSSPPSFTGSAKITGGAGRYKGAKGTITFKGSFDAQSDATVNITGSFSY